MYREDEDTAPREKKISALLTGFLDRFKGVSREQATEYSDLVAKSAKLTGMSYIVMHKRIERGFKEASLDHVISLLNRWCHQAEKSKNTGSTFNYLFKQYREQNDLPDTKVSSST